MSFFKNKTVLVTGASSGIGREMCLQLAKKGAKPVLVARRKKRLEELEKQIQDTYSTASHIIVADLTKPDAAANLKKTTDAAGLQIDILINNAGFGYKGPFLKSSAENYRKMADLNMGVLTELCYLYAEGMIERSDGGIMNVASMAGFSPVPMFSVYAATKSYVIQFSQALWQEFRGKGVHVSALCPGPVETDFFEVASIEPAKMSLRTIQTAQQVSSIALQGLEKNKRLIITSIPLRVMRLATGFTPTRLSMKAAEIVMGKES